MRRQPNFEIFKEPRGFIKLIEVGIAIFAFATTAGYYNEYRVTSYLTNTTNCNSTIEKNGRVFETLTKFEYPFDGNQYYTSDFTTDSCTFSLSCKEHKGKEKSKSTAQFFVFTGVAAFLYCLIAMGYYAFFEDQERAMYSIDVSKFSFVVIDFVFSVTLVIFWFCGSIAWAADLSGFKDETDPNVFVASSPCCTAAYLDCKVTKDPNYASLKVSIILGFLNLFVWLGNLWFLFKETPWHNPRQEILHDNTVQ